MAATSVGGFLALYQLMKLRGLKCTPDWNAEGDRRIGNATAGRIQAKLDLDT